MNDIQDSLNKTLACKDTKQEASRLDVQARQYVLLIMAVSFVIRSVLAATLELGNDEVYYWSYAAHPALGYYDHPGMVGWLIRLCTINLTFTTEYLVRLPAILLGTVNIWLMYVLGKGLGNARSGVIAAGLYAASAYGALISGMLVLPDTPLTFFWILALLVAMYMASPAQPHTSEGMHTHTRATWLVLLGACIGLAMLSKYQGVMLAVGLVGYLAVFQRRVFQSPWFYVAVVLAICINLPTIVWHASTHFVSFTHQGGLSLQGRKLDWTEFSLNPNTFIAEIGGQILYANPVVWCIVVWALWKLYKMRRTITEPQRIVLWMSIPIILVFTSVSLIRSTLPHWALPGYIGLMALAGTMLSQRQPSHRLIPISLRIAFAVIMTACIIALGAFQFGWLDSMMPQASKIEETGRSDASMDSYGWQQIEAAFATIRQYNVQSGHATLAMPLVATRWFTIAHLEYYIAQPLGMQVVGLGGLNDLNNYVLYDGPTLAQGQNAWFISTSRAYVDPSQLLEWFERVQSVDTIAILRKGHPVGYAFVAIAEGYRGQTKEVQTP